MLITLVLSGAIFAALLFGLLATTASPIYVAVGIGLIAGPVLLARPDLVVWLVLLGTLLLNGLIGLAFPQYGKVAWLFSMMGFLLLVAGFFKIFEARRLRELWVPGFVVGLLFLLAYSALAALFFSDGVAEALIGFKRYYQLFGLAFFLALLPLSIRSESRLNYWLISIFFLFLLQFPFAIFQRVFLVPLREGMWKQGVVPIDIVSGSFETSLEGGGSSSIMVIFLLLGLAYVLTMLRDGLIPRGRAFFLVILIGAPLFLGETKIALVLLPLVFFLVFVNQIRRSPVSGVFAIFFGLILTGLLAWVYFSVFAAQGNTFESQVEKALAYNFGTVGYYDRYSLNRTTAVIFWWKEHGLHNIVSMFFGHGVGSSYSGAGALVPGHLSKIYPFMAINFTSLSSMLWDVGLFGVGVFVYVMISAWRYAGRLYRSESDGRRKAQLMALRVSIVMTAFAMLYSNSLVSSMSHEAIFAFTIGYLAWLARKQRFQSLQGK